MTRASTTFTESEVENAALGCLRRLPWNVVHAYRSLAVHPKSSVAEVCIEGTERIEENPNGA